MRYLSQTMLQAKRLLDHEPAYNCMKITCMHQGLMHITTCCRQSKAGTIAERLMQINHGSSMTEWLHVLLQLHCHRQCQVSNAFVLAFMMQYSCKQPTRRAGPSRPDLTEGMGELSLKMIVVMRISTREKPHAKIISLLV